jgi:predicted O-methyltransferase YrrM
MGIDVIVPVRRRCTIDRLLYSFSRNTTEPDTITLISNELVADEIRTYGLNVRVLRFSSSYYPIGFCDAALRRNLGIWTSEASHVVMFDDDQLAPPDLIETSRSILLTQPYFWGHHRFIAFEQPVDEILKLPPVAGRAREFPPNSWHSWRSAYAGLFGAERSMLVQIGGFDMRFSGRHGGEDQNLGRRLAQVVYGQTSIYVHEPPFAWHPEENIPWDDAVYSNLCAGGHEITVDASDAIHRCGRCPFYWVPDDQLYGDDVGLRFDPSNVGVHVEQIQSSGSVTPIAQLCNKISARNRNEFAEILRGPYMDYTQRVSPADMAISLQTAAFLFLLCEELKPARVLDLGSGFSSVVLRMFANLHPGTEVWSVDDDPHWIRCTREFLAACGLRTQNMVLWSELSHMPRVFNLVFHDLGSMAVRLSTLPVALALCDVNGVVVLDDMPKEEYAPHADRLLRQSDWSWRTVRSYTLDEFGRFCGMAVRNAAF